MDEQRTPVVGGHFELSTPRDDGLCDDTTPVVQPPPPTHALKYRPDIDGLRCLAVVPVVLFHAYPTSVPGGFIGVDVFFVISGFLISGILFKEVQQRKFTYANFYSRRIRRIFPALILVLTFTLVAGCFWYLEDALVSMADTLAAGVVFGANIQVLLLKQTYFSASVKEDPLLHLWSLGVEEQFYIFWPLFVAIVAKFPYRAALAAQLVVLVGSFAFNIAFLGYDGNNNWSFYFPLSRFWQMAVGGLLAFLNLQHGTPLVRNVAISTLAAVAGLALVVVGYAVITESMAFPGWWSMLPTLGAGLLIVSGPDTFVHRHLLALRPAVFVGQISYALYLWHWPLLVYAKARFPNAELRPWVQEPYMMMVFSVAASVATLYCVENHVRRRQHKLVVPVLVGCMLALGAVALAVHHDPYHFSVLAQPKAAVTGPVLVPVATHTNGSAAEVPNMSKPPMFEAPTLQKILAAKNDYQADGPEFHTIDAGSVYIPTSENMILN
ncbi:acyltransferase 3, partial [Achlya hypogyna]